MSGYTDMLVSKKTKDRLKKFADSKGLNIAQLLEHICDMLERTQLAEKTVKENEAKNEEKPL